MHLSPREVDKLALHAAGSLAQKRLARGVRLNLPEATALIASVLLELIRDGPDGANFGVADLMDVGRRILGKRHVLPAVAHVLHEVQVKETVRDVCWLRDQSMCAPRPPHRTPTQLLTLLALAPVLIS